MENTTNIIDKNPLVDSRKVLDSAMEPGAPDFYDEVSITGVTSRNVLGTDLPRFTIVVGENKREGELSASTEEVDRYKEQVELLNKEQSAT